MSWTNHALDMMATRLSRFTSPIIPELRLKDEKTLQNNILESTLGVFGDASNTHIRHTITNQVRRTFAPIEMYRLGRAHALEYTESIHDQVVSAYFLALTFFESCIAYSWQVCDSMNYLLGKKAKVFRPGDGSAWERLHDVYTRGTKHPYGIYDRVRHGEMPTTIWLTNEGIQTIAGSQVSFQELSEMISANNDLFYDIQKAVRMRHAGAKSRRTGSVVSGRRSG